MKFSNCIFFFLILSLLLPACKKNVIEIDREYIGYWQSVPIVSSFDYTYFRIDENGYGVWEESYSGTPKRGFKGTVKAYKNHLKIGSNIATPTFTIIQSPTQLSGPPCFVGAPYYFCDTSKRYFEMKLNIPRIGSSGDLFYLFKIEDR